MGDLEAVGGFDGFDDAEEEADLVANGGGGVEFVDGAAVFDVLHDEIESAAFGGAAIDGAGDGGMFEHGEDAALGVETANGVGVGVFAVNFEGGELGEDAVGALGEVDAAHAAFAEEAEDFPGAEPLADRGIVPEEGGRDGDAEQFIVFGVVGANFENAGAEGCVVTTLLVEKGVPIGAREVEEAGGEGTHLAPLFACLPG